MGRRRHAGARRGNGRGIAADGDGAPQPRNVSRFRRALREASGVPIDYQRCGAVELALNDREALELEQRAARQSAHRDPLGIDALCGQRGRAILSGRCAGEPAGHYRRSADGLPATTAFRFMSMSRWSRYLPDGSGVRTIQGQLSRRRRTDLGRSVEFRIGFGFCSFRRPCRCAGT